MPAPSEGSLLTVFHPLTMHLLLIPLAVAASDCAFYAPANPGCHAWSALDLLPAADNEVQSSWPDTYWVAAPCRSLQNATLKTACPSTPLEQLQTAFVVQVPGHRFTLESGADAMSTYTFGTHKAKHNAPTHKPNQLLPTPRSPKCNRWQARLQNHGKIADA